MTVLHHLSDRIPAVVRGQDAWSQEDQRHLVGCDDCQAEWQLHRLTIGLSRRVEASLDVEAVIRGVQDRLASSPPGPPRRGSILRFPSLRWAVPLTAAALLAVTVLPRLGGGGGDQMGAGTAVVQAWLPELEALSVDELELLLDVLPADEASSLPTPRLGDLTEQELESLLRSMEG